MTNRFADIAARLNANCVGGQAPSAAPLDTMRRLYEAGFSLIPLGRENGKKPLVASWTGHRLPFETVIKRMQEVGSKTYGIRLNGLCVVDCDTDNLDTRQLVSERFGATPVMVRTARGVHYYFKTGDKVPLSIQHPGIAIDFKTGGSQFVVGPGSVRPDGIVYVSIGQPLSSPGLLPVFHDNAPPERTYGGKVAKGLRNTFLWKRARQLAPCCDSEQEIFDNLIGFRDLECEDPDSLPDREVQGIAAWAWKLRCENRLWEGRNSVVRLNRLVLDRLAQHKHGADALMLYSIATSNHGHIPGKLFAIVPDAMIENRLIPFNRNRVYRAIRTLIDVDLLLLAKKGRVHEPNLYRLLHPAFPYNQGREGLSITLVSNTGHGGSVCGGE